MNIHFQTAITFCQSANFVAAIPHFDKSIEASPLHVESFFNRGLAYFSLEDYQKAIEDFTQALTLAPDNAQILGERAVAKHLLKDNRNALNDFDEALRLEPQNPYRYASRAYVKAFIGDILGAIEDYKNAIQLDPDDAIALNNLGLLEERLGYKSDANENFRKADAIADEGKTFEKPDLDEILQKFEEKQYNKSEAERLQKQPKGVDESKETINRFQIIKKVFTSKAQFQDFLTFVKNKLKF